jgi:phenylacetate-CoA ligase
LLEIRHALEHSQWESPERIRHIQLTALKSLLQHAYENVPYYRESIDAQGLNVTNLHRIANFRRLPVLTKTIINQNQKSLTAANVSRTDLIDCSTSGSTGQALRFKYDMHAWSYRRAAQIRNRQWLGIQLGDRVASLWGAPIDINKAESLRGRLHRYISNTMTLSAYDLKPVTMDGYIDRLARFQPRLISSYPGPLTVFANHVQQTAQSISGLRALLCSAETLYPWQKHTIERAFEKPVYNFYGCREFGAIAQECVYRQGLHVNQERFLIEIVDEDMQPVPRGESGELLITDLQNFGMPFIRYRIGDTSSWQHGTCQCGRNLPRLKHLEGRTLDVVQTPSGNRLGGTFWTLLFRSRPGIDQFQVVQEHLDSVLITYVKTLEGNEPPLDYFTKKIKQACGAAMNVTFQQAETIPKTASGKHRFVVSKLGL